MSSPHRRLYLKRHEVTQEPQLDLTKDRPGIKHQTVTAKMRQPKMGVLSAVALVLLLRLSAAQKEGSVCLKAGARSCAECLQVSESCGWCSDQSFLGLPSSTRCDDLQSLTERGCRPENIQNPRGTITIQENRPLSDHRTGFRDEHVTQIQPQKLTLTLRPGEPQTFSVNFKLAEDYPIDLYFLMDLSSSMKDNLENMKNLGDLLVNEIQRISSNFRIGLGSIVRTTSSFSYKNILRLTDKGDEFNRLVSQQQVSGDLDSAEGGFDAIIQTALCEEQVGWRSAARFLVVATNRGFSLTTDGAPTPHSEQCLLQNHSYTHSRQVSPTESRLTQTLRDHNIQSVFAVSENVQTVYKELTERLPKAAVGTLSSNSSDVLKLISDAYNSLSLEVILENSQLPRGVSISYKSLCQNRTEGTGENGHKCSNVSIGDEVSFEVSVSAQKCPGHDGAKVMKIHPLGSNEEVQVTLNFVCECQCSGQGEPQSDRCFRKGTFECGTCRCDPGWVGGQCECSVDDAVMMDTDATCRKNQDSHVCSNNGDCVCGTCECKKRENPEERYSGRYCECDNFNCDRSNNKLCGGHGRCECRVCICDANYTGSACDCSMDTTSCLASNGQLCNGRGTCECGVCRCTDPKFFGPTCETCPTCPGVCTRHRDCVQCRAFGTGPKAQSCESDCSYFTMTKVKTVSDLPQPFDDSFPLSHCKERDENDCWWYFAYSLKDGAHLIWAVDKLDCPSPFWN